jgi:hypothetical protein
LLVLPKLVIQPAGGFMVKALRLCVFVTLALIASQVYADSSATINELDFDVGPSLPIFGGDSPSQYMGLASYRFTDNWYYVEGNLGGWVGTRHTGLAAASVGLNYEDLSIGTGPAVISTTSTALSTHAQFMSTLRWTFNPLPIYIDYRHVSNGSKIFGSREPNHGENFFEVGYAYRF